MRVLIIGCGYVGLPLGVELARRGHEVCGLRRGETGGAELRAAGLTPLRADITRPETLAGLPRDFDWVVNCAASGGGAADDYRRLYLEGNRNLAAWLAGAPVKKFIYTSSTSVYGQNDGSVVTEDSPAKPEAETAKVLIQAENCLLAAARSPDQPANSGQAGSPPRLPAVILRVAGIYGPGRGFWLKSFLNGTARLDGAGGRWLNLIHRDDVIGCIIAALERGAPGEIYNVTDNAPVTQREMFAWLAAELNRPSPPPSAAGAESPRKRGATSKRVSNAKLRAELGYTFRFPDFRAGFAAELRQPGAA